MFADGQLRGMNIGGEAWLMATSADTTDGDKGVANCDSLGGLPKSETPRIYNGEIQKLSHFQSLVISH